MSELSRSAKTSLRSVAGSPSGGRAELCFDPASPVFAGHFPGRPLVPGVFLIEALRSAVAESLGRELEIAEVSSAKFSAELAPGQPARLSWTLAASDAGWSCRAELRVEEQLACSLRLRLEEGAPCSAS